MSHAVKKDDKKKDEAEKKQGNLVDVPRSQAALEAERYADLENDLRNKKDALIIQGQKVIAAMKTSKQRTLTFTDEFGFKHTFSIFDSGEKLKHSRKQEV